MRVISRILKAARQFLVVSEQAAQELFRDRTRAAKRLAKEIIDTLRSRGEAAGELRKAGYQRLITIGEAMLEQAKKVGELLSEQKPDGSCGEARGAEKVAERLGQFVPRVQAVVEQTKRRMLQGETVPAGEKLVSIFEPQTAIIRKGKLSKPTEYGRMLWLDEVEGGIISRYEVLKGNPADQEAVQPSLEHHKSLFKQPPRLLAADRGCWSEANEKAAMSTGVEQVCLPKPGYKSAERQEYERQGWFRRGCNWRAGIEGRIHGLKKRHKLERCMYHGDGGMQRWVGWGVISHDLWRIAQATAPRRPSLS